MAKTNPNSKPYAGVFGGMDFPGYQYEHYPLMLTKGEGKLPQEQLIVENKEEEDAAVKDGWKLKAKVGQPVTVTEQELSDKDDEIAALKRQIEAMAKPAGATAPVKPAVAAAPAVAPVVPK